MKKPKKFIFFSIGILLFAFILWLILAFVNKWDIIGCLTSSGAIVAYFIVALWLTFCGYILINDWNDNRGKRK